MRLSLTLFLALSATSSVFAAAIPDQALAERGGTGGLSGNNWISQGEPIAERGGTGPLGGTDNVLSGRGGSGGLAGSGW